MRSTSDRLRDVAGDVRLLPTLLKIVALSVSAAPERPEDAAAPMMAQLRRVVREACEAMEAAALEAERHRELQVKDYERAERRVNRVIDEVEAAAVADSFDPHGWFVYLLWGDDDARPLYVGRSSNVLSRLGSHMGDRSKRYKVRRVSLIRCLSAAEMDATEGRLIAKHQPPWNVVGVSGRRPHPGYAPPPREICGTSVGNRFDGDSRSNGLGPQGVPFA